MEVKDDLDFKGYEYRKGAGHSSPALYKRESGFTVSRSPFPKGFTYDPSNDQHLTHYFDGKKLNKSFAKAKARTAMKKRLPKADATAEHKQRDSALEREQKVMEQSLAEDLPVSYFRTNSKRGKKKKKSQSVSRFMEDVGENVFDVNLQVMMRNRKNSKGQFSPGVAEVKRKVSSTPGKENYDPFRASSPNPSGRQTAPPSFLRAEFDSVNESMLICPEDKSETLNSTMVVRHGRKKPLWPLPMQQDKNRPHTVDCQGVTALKNRAPRTTDGPNTLAWERAFSNPGPGQYHPDRATPIIKPNAGGVRMHKAYVDLDSKEIQERRRQLYTPSPGPNCNHRLPWGDEEKMRRSGPRSPPVQWNERVKSPEKMRADAASRVGPGTYRAKSPDHDFKQEPRVMIGNADRARHGGSWHFGSIKTMWNSGKDMSMGEVYLHESLPDARHHHVGPGPGKYLNYVNALNAKFESGAKVHILQAKRDISENWPVKRPYVVINDDDYDGANYDASSKIEAVRYPSFPVHKFPQDPLGEKPSETREKIRTPAPNTYFNKPLLRPTTVHVLGSASPILPERPQTSVE